MTDEEYEKAFEKAFNTKCAEIMNMPLEQVKKLIEEYEPYDKTLGEIARDLTGEEVKDDDRGTDD